MYKASKWLEVIELNQSLVFSTRPCTWHTKLYRLKGSTGRSMPCNFSLVFLLSSPSKAATFGPIEKAIDVLMMDVLTNVSTSLSFGRSSCSWSTNSSLPSYSLGTWTSTVFGFFPLKHPFFFRTWILLLEAFLVLLMLVT